MTEPVAKRADQLVVGDRIQPGYMPAYARSGEGVVRYVETYPYQGADWIFVAFACADGDRNCAHYLPGGELMVIPASKPVPPVGFQDAALGWSGPCVASLHIPTPGDSCLVCGAEGMRYGEHVEVSAESGPDGASAQCACTVEVSGFDTLAEAHAELAVHIADPTGEGYSRADDAEVTQPIAGRRREPHFESGRAVVEVAGGLVEVDPPEGFIPASTKSSGLQYFEDGRSNAECSEEELEGH